MRSNQLFQTRGNLICYCISNCSKMQGSLPNCNWTVVFVIVIISFANVAANGEITKASNGLRKRGNHEESIVA